MVRARTIRRMPKDWKPLTRSLNTVYEAIVTEMLLNEIIDEQIPWLMFNARALL
jgi:hypothetical protein